MRCNSLLNNYCYIIISWLPVLLLETEKCNSWNECIGNDMFCSKETFSDSMVTFHRWLCLALLATATSIRAIIPRFLVAPSWCRAVGSPKRAQVEFYHRFGFTCTFFILVILVKRSKLVPQHSPIMGGAIHQQTKWLPAPRQVSLSLLCFVPGLQLRRCPFGLSCCNYMFHHLSVSNHKLWRCFMVVLNGWATTNCGDSSLSTDKHLYESFRVHRHLMLEYLGYKVMVPVASLNWLYQQVWQDWLGGVLATYLFNPYPTWGDCVRVT